MQSSPAHITSPVFDTCVPTDQCFWEVDSDFDKDSTSREQGPVNPDREEGPREGFPVSPEGGEEVDINMGGINPEDDVNLRLLRLQDQREQTEFNVDILEGEIMHIERNQVECIRRFYAADNHVDRNREYSMYYELTERMNEVSSRLEDEMENLDDICEEIERMEEDVLWRYGFGGVEAAMRPDELFPGGPRNPLRRDGDNRRSGRNFEGDRQRDEVQGQVAGGRAARYNRY